MAALADADVEKVIAGTRVSVSADITHAHGMPADLAHPEGIIAAHRFGHVAGHAAIILHMGVAGTLVL